MAVTILLADDHHVMRQGLRMLLEAQADFQVIAEAGDGLEAVKLAERLKPTVILQDLIMPGVDDHEISLASIRYAHQFMPNYLKNRKLFRFHVGRPLVADMIAIVGSLDTVMGEVDR